METLTARNPRIVALFLLVIVAAGLSALLALGRQEDPTITNLNASITTPYPGADPERVEALVTRPLEEAVRTIPEVSLIESTSLTGISLISIELDETVDPDAIEGIWTDVQDEISSTASSLPADARPPEFDSDVSGAFGAIFALSGGDVDIPPAILARFAEEAAERLRNTPGTKRVTLFGMPQEEVRVTLDADRAAALGLTPGAVAARIAGADTKGRAGRLTDGTQDILLDVSGDIEALERLRSVVVTTDGFGTATQLRDIAEVSRVTEAPADSYAISNGHDAVLIAVMAEEGLQVDVWMGWLQEDAARVAASLPASLSLEQVFDQSTYTADRLAEVATNMAIGVALVVVVLLITLGLRAALIVAVVLPVVSLATLASMNIIGLPIHQMSVTGLIVALGLLVDAAIVMTDEIAQRLRAGMSRIQAAGSAVRRLAAPLLASTVTTALSFVPMILLPGPAGDFVGSIAIAVVLMLVWSLVVAVTITPAVASWVLPEGGHGGGLSVPRLASGFRSTLRWSVANPLRSVALALVLPITGFLSFPTLSAQFFPGVDRDQFHIEVDLAPGTAISKTRELARQIDTALRGTDGIESVAWVIGESAPAFYYNIIGNRDGAPGFAQALVTTESPAATVAMLTPLQDRLTRDFPAARILVRGLVQGPPVEAPVELRVVGPDQSTLRELGGQLRAELLGLPAVTSVRTDLEGGAPKVVVDIDEPAARLAGLDLGDISRQLETALDGALGGSLIEAGEELPIRVRLSEAFRGDLSQIATLRILPANAEAQAASGALPGLPLSAIAEIKLEPSASPISRRNGERVNTVQAFVAPDILPEGVLSSARGRLDDIGFTLPSGYRLEIGGDADARGQVVGNLLASLGLIVTLSIATVVLTFNSFRLSVVTFVVAGLAAGLSFLALAVFGYPFGITAIIGLIGSIGVSINAAIIILTGLQADDAASSGDTDAMAEVVMGSSRHILSTTLTTAGGFLPLIVAGGGFWPPFAMAVAGGVVLSTVVSFYFTPPAFAMLRPRKHRSSSKASEPSIGYPRLAAE